MREIQSAILRRAANPLSQRLVAAFHVDLFDLPDQIGVAPDLDGALLLLHDRQAARLLLLRNLVLHGEGGGIGPRRILEAEQGIVLHFVEQTERVLKIGLGFAGKPTMMSVVMEMLRRAFFIHSIRRM